MTQMFINYDPFAMESQILIKNDDDNTIGTTYSNSELSQLAETIALRASELADEQIKVYVRAPQIFYDKLITFVQAAQTNYSLTNIIMERI